MRKSLNFLLVIAQFYGSFNGNGEYWLNGENVQLMIGVFMSNTVEQLVKTFSEEIKLYLVKQIRRAYEANFNCFDPSIGHDAMTFGLMLYKSKVHFISQLAEEFDWIKITKRYPYFDFQIGEYSISSYRAGRTMEVDLADSFPNNRTRAWKLVKVNKNQLRLPFDGSTEPDDSDCRNLILADIGNENDGLERLFLAIPSEISSDYRITKWSTIFPIWNRVENDDFGDIPALLPKDMPPLPPVEILAPPSLKLKDRVNKGEEKQEEKK